MSRHPELEGAGAEYADPADYYCDACLRNTYSGRLFRYQGQRVCAECAVRLSGEPLCDYCMAPTFGDYRRISRAHSLTHACGVCTDKWDADDPVPESATFDEWKSWVGLR